MSHATIESTHVSDTALEARYTPEERLGVGAAISGVLNLTRKSRRALQEITPLVERDRLAVFAARRASILHHLPPSNSFISSQLALYNIPHATGDIRGRLEQTDHYGLFGAVQLFRNALGSDSIEQPFAQLTRRINRLTPDGTTEDRRRIIFLTLAHSAIRVANTGDFDATGNPLVTLPDFDVTVSLGLTPDTTEAIRQDWISPYKNLDEV